MIWLKCLLTLSLFLVGICHPSEPPNARDSLSSAILETLQLSSASKPIESFEMTRCRENVKCAFSTQSKFKDTSSFSNIYKPLCTSFSLSVLDYEAEVNSFLYPTQCCVAIFSAKGASITADNYEAWHSGNQAQDTHEASLSNFKGKFDRLIKDRGVNLSLMTSFMQIPPYSSYPADSTNPVAFRIVPLKVLDSYSELYIDITNSFSLPAESSSYVCKYSILDSNCSDASTCKQTITCTYDNDSKSLKVTGFSQGITDDVQIFIEGSQGGLKYPSTPGLYNIPITLQYSIPILILASNLYS